MKTIKISAAMLVIMAALTVGAARAEQTEAQKQRLENLRVVVEEVCLSMKPYMIRPENVKKIYVADQPEINAYADSGGNVVFFTGMIDFVRNESELAAVCGHEMAHLSAQHIKRSIGTSILATVAQGAIGGTLGDIAGSALFTKQSRSHEREADERGLNYMWSAGFDPTAVWKFWQSLQNHYEGGGSDLEKFFSTHPVTGERIENLKVLLVRYCKRDPDRIYCDDILNDESLVNLYNAFETR